MPNATPFLMFQGDAQSAMDLYVASLPDSGIDHVERYGEGEPGAAGSVKVATFHVCGREFKCSDNPLKTDFTFTPSSSVFVDFDTREQLERAFRELSEDGEVLMPLGNYGFSPRFGWVNDRFGVSWQLNIAT